MRLVLMRMIERHGDAALATALTVLVLLDLVLGGGPAAIEIPTAILAIALGLAAARRSQAPLVLLGIILAVSVATALIPTLRDARAVTSIGLFLMLAVYSAAAYTSGVTTRIAIVMLGVICISTFALDREALTAEGVVFYAIVFGAPWAAGRAIRARRLNDGRLEQERARAAAAIVDERARIARELHDVVAHSISVMILQARGGRHALETHPDEADAAFANIERTGQESLDEMRRLLGLLRSSDEELALAPQPGLRELHRLVDQVRDAGLPVEVLVEGEPRELPPGVDLSAYRIVQEALTNALRHAGPASARVQLRYLPDTLELEVADDGSGVGDGAGAGYGLIGMRERVSVYGGELDAGRRPGGGYALRVRLPLGPARA